MATEVVSGMLGEIRAASTADGGTALSTTAVFIQLPLKSYHLMVTPRNFSTAVVAKVAVNPWLVVLKTTDGMVTAPTDYSNYAQDGDTGTDVDLSSLDTVANGDFLLVGSHTPFRGVYCDVDAANGTASRVLTVSYWNGVWTDSGDTNGTSSATTFDQDGLVVWTIPASWRSESLSTIYPNCPSVLMNSGTSRQQDIRADKLYWTRWEVNGALDSDTTLNSMCAANRSTAYMELVSGQTFQERIKHGEIGGIGCVEALTNAGTANLIVDVATIREGEFD